MDGAVAPLSNTPSWRGAQLGEAQGQLYLYFTCLTFVATHRLTNIAYFNIQ